MDDIRLKITFNNTSKITKFPRNITISALKKEICNKGIIQVSDFRVLLCGCELLDGDTVGDILNTDEEIVLEVPQQQGKF